MERYHSTYLTGNIDIDGTPTMSGPQGVGAHGVPEHIAELFRNDERLQRVLFEYKGESSGETCGVVYRRISPAPSGAQENEE